MDNNEQQEPVVYKKLKDIKELKGEYTGTFVGGLYNTPTHFFKTDEGKIGVNGFKVLNDELEKFQEGDKLHLIYEGMKKGKNFPYHAASVLPLVD